MVYEGKWTAEAHEDLLVLFDYLIENVSAREAGRICSTVFDSTRYLSDFPRLYEETPQYGRGVRRIGVMGQNVLYEVDDVARQVKVLAVNGQRENPRNIR